MMTCVLTRVILSRNLDSWRESIDDPEDLLPIPVNEQEVSFGFDNRPSVVTPLLDARGICARSSRCGSRERCDPNCVLWNSHSKLASGSLHTLTIARIPFTYTFWNLASAILGALFGATAALAMSFQASPGSIARIGLAVCQMPWKWPTVRPALLSHLRLT